MRLIQDSADLQLVERGRFRLHYEGDTTGGARVSKATRDRARGGLSKSRAKTKRGKQKAVGRSGAGDSKGRLFRTQVGRSLTTSQVKQRTKARAAKRAARTPEGRVQSQIKVNRVRKAQRRANLRKSFKGG